MPSRRVVAVRVLTQLSMASLGVARQARRDAGWLGLSRFGKAGKLGCCMSKRGIFRRGMAGSYRHGVEWLGSASQVGARQGRQVPSIPGKSCHGVAGKSRLSSKSIRIKEPTNEESRNNRYGAAPA